MAKLITTLTSNCGHEVRLFDNGGFSFRNAANVEVSPANVHGSRHLIGTDRARREVVEAMKSGVKALNAVSDLLWTEA